MTRSIGGVLPVVLMPYGDSGEIDATAFRRQADHVFAAGADGIVVGQVSELLRLDHDERLEVARLCAEAAAGHGVSIMSTGAETAEQAIAYSRHAESVGIDGVLVMHPATAALTDDEMFEYFARVVESVTVPVLVHHAKSFAKTPLSIEVQARLLEEFGEVRVQFKPEYSPTPPRVSELRDRTGGRARIFEGEGGMWLIDCHARGLAGTIPAAEIVEIVVALWRLLEAGERERAEPLAHGLSYLMCHMMSGLDTYVSVAKRFLHDRGLIGTTTVRGPVRFQLDSETRTEVGRTYTRLLTMAEELR